MQNKNKEQIAYWLSLPSEQWPAQWQAQAGEQLRQAIAARPWQTQDLAQDRGLLDQAIHRVLKDPADWAAQLVLRFYGRFLTATPPHWLAPWIATQTDQLLEVLPALPSLDVTVMMPTYNRLSKLKRAVASVQAQTGADWHLLIADDGSSDGTEAWCRELTTQDQRVRYLRKSANSGLADTFELLCQEARSELVLSLADDDCLMPGCLQALVSLFRHFPWIAMAGGGYYQLHLKQGQLMAKQYGPYYPAPQIANPRIELQRCGIVNPLFGGGQLLRRSALAALSPADPGLGQHTYSIWDWLTSAQMLAHYEVGYTPEIVVAYLDEADTPNSFGLDWGRSLLKMLELLIADYAALFGPPGYPAPIVNYFLEVIAEPALVQSFHKVLHEHQEAQQMDAFIQAQRAGWESHRQMRAGLPQLPTACLVDEHSTSGLTAGQIPGLAQNQAVPALRQLIQSLLQKPSRS